MNGVLEYKTEFFSGTPSFSVHPAVFSSQSHHCFENWGMPSIERFETVVSMEKHRGAQPSYIAPNNQPKPTRNGMVQFDFAADSWNQLPPSFFEVDSDNVTKMNGHGFGYNAGLCSSLSQQQKLEQATFASSSTLQRIQFGGIDHNIWKSDPCSSSLVPVIANITSVTATECKDSLLLHRFLKSPLQTLQCRDQ